MASLIDCPHCGNRPREEFVVRGAAAPVRPAVPDAPQSAGWIDYVYLRDNPKGPFREHWYHASGCGRWLEVERDTVTHEVTRVADVQASARLK